MEELNRKLAEWAGFTIVRGYDKRIKDFEINKDGYYCYWESPAGRTRWFVPEFTKSLDACFKWLVPKLPSNLGITIGKDGDRPYFYCRIEGAYFDSVRLVKTAETPALALCKAIEKLIDNEEAR